MQLNAKLMVVKTDQTANALLHDFVNISKQKLYKFIFKKIWL